MAIWHLTNAGYFRNNITIRLRERIGSSHHSKRGSEDGGGCPFLHVDDQATNQPGPCLSLLPLLNARLSPYPKQHGAGNPATSSVVPTNHTHTIRGRAESESSPGRVEWFQADEDTQEGGTQATQTVRAHSPPRGITRILPRCRNKIDFFHLRRRALPISVAFWRVSIGHSTAQGAKEYAQQAAE